MEIFGRQFSVQGCDKFTQEHYRNKFGYDFPLSNLNFDEDMKQVPVQIPPYNGFGDEEDSLSNVNKLLPKAPRKDYFKWVDNQIQLRFNALMVTNKPEDIGRRFTITLYMNDDTVMVYEPQVRNSGIVSGKFLEKMKYKNKEAGGRFFQPQDFLIGKLVTINGYKFEVQEFDERTRKWYEENIYPQLYREGQNQGQNWNQNGQQGVAPPNPCGQSAAWENLPQGTSNPNPGQDNDQFIDQYYSQGPAQNQQMPSRRN